MNWLYEFLTVGALTVCGIGLFVVICRGILQSQADHRGILKSLKNRG